MVKLLKASIVVIVIIEILFTVHCHMTWGVNNDLNATMFIKWIMSLGATMLIGFLLADRAYTLGLNYVK